MLKNLQTDNIFIFDNNIMIKNGLNVGNHFFMAPELFLEDYDYRVDIYSIGCVWYELLSS